MGYTHYYDSLSCDAELADAARALVGASAVSICDGFGEGEPIITDDKIWLNGDGSLDEEYETFSVAGSIADRSRSQFTKTARKPYDEVVTAILTYAVLHEKDGWESIASDGDIIDWHPGVLLYEAVFGSLSDAQLMALAKVLGLPDEWGDGLPRTREQYDGTVSFRKHSRDSVIWLSTLVRRVSKGSDVDVDTADGHECCRLLEACSGISELVPWEEDPTPENLGFLASVSQLLARRWSEEFNSLSAGWDAAFAKAGDWIGASSMLAEEHGFNEDVESLVAGVPLKDVVA